MIKMYRFRIEFLRNVKAEKYNIFRFLFNFVLVNKDIFFYTKNNDIFRLPIMYSISVLL